MNKYKLFSKMWFLALLLVAFVAGCASNGGDQGTFVSLKLTPAAASIPVTGTIQYSVLAIYGDGSAREVTGSATYAAGTAGVSFGATKGLATGVTANVNPVVITASYNGKTATATLTVNAATSKGLRLSPTTASIPVTGNQKYTLLEIFSDGTSQLRTTDAATTWTLTNNAGNISLTPSGLTAGLASGLISTPAGTPVTITASYGGNSATATLTVNAATSKGLKLSPTTASIPVTGNQQYTLIEIFSDGTSQPRTTDLATSWATSNNSGNVSLTSSGLTAGLASGLIATPVGTPVTISASYGGNTVTAALTVNAATSKGLRLSPTTASIPVTGNQQYTLIEIFSDGTSQLRTTDAATTWVLTNNTGNISITPSGLTAGLASGLIATPAGTPVTISASYGGNTVTATLTVNAATSKGLRLSPATASIPATGNQQYTLLEIFSDGTSQLRTTDVATIWTTLNNTGNVSLTPSGLTAGLASGLSATPAGTPVTISATYGGNTVTADLIVNAATSASFKVTPLTATISINGGGQQFAAIETFSDGSTFDRTTDVATTWSAVDLTGGPGVSTIGLNTGIATGAVIGTSTITATYTVGLVIKTATAVLTVTAPDPGTAGMVNLLSLETYGLISHDAMTISAVPTTHIYGDVALTAADSLVGFGAGSAADPPTSPYVTGLISTNARGNVAASVTAQQDLVTVFADLSGRSVDTQYLAGATQLSGRLLTPGVYRAGAAAAADTFALDNSLGPLVLDALGNPDAVFIFQASDITTTNGSILLQGGANAKNVFWVMTASATIGNGTGTVFQGTVVAGTSITVNGANVQGRMLAGASGAGAIGGVNSVITVPK